MSSLTALLFLYSLDLSIMRTPSLDRTAAGGNGFEFSSVLTIDYFRAHKRRPYPIRSCGSTLEIEGIRVRVCVMPGLAGAAAAYVCPEIALFGFNILFYAVRRHANFIAQPHTDGRKDDVQPMPSVIA